jgi:hypothetical protein
MPYWLRRYVPDSSSIFVSTDGQHWAGIPIAVSRDRNPKELNDEERAVLYAIRNLFISY